MLSWLLFFNLQLSITKPPYNFLNIEIFDSALKKNPGNESIIDLDEHIFLYSKIISFNDNGSASAIFNVWLFIDEEVLRL